MVDYVFDYAVSVNSISILQWTKDIQNGINVVL